MKVYTRRQQQSSGSGRADVRPVRRGAHLVEFAVVAPVFFLLVFGLVELGRGLMVSHLLTSAARKGCRSAIVQGTDSGDVTQTVQDALSGLGVNGHSTSVQVNGADADAATASSGDAITVIVSVPTAKVSWVPGLSWIRGNLTGQYTLRRE